MQEGKRNALTDTLPFSAARKIAVLFNDTVRLGMAYTDPGTGYYEDRYKERLLSNLRRRAKSLGFVLVEPGPNAGQVVVS
jgi:transposase